MSRAGRPSERRRQQIGRIASLINAARARVVKEEGGDPLCGCRPRTIIPVPVGLELIELRCATCYAMLGRAFYAGSAQRDRALEEIAEAEAIESELLGRPAGVGSAAR